MSQTTIIESYKKLYEISKDLDNSIIVQLRILKSLDPNYPNFKDVDGNIDSSMVEETNGLIDDLGRLVDRINNKNLLLFDINTTINNLIDPDLSIIKKQTEKQ